MAAAQRIRQGIRALLAFSQPADMLLAEHYLSPAEMRLFCRMHHSERLHSLHVLRDILAQGPTPDSLAIAALMHDVGKSRYPLQVWQKTLIVLVRAFLPALYTHWSHGDAASFWQRAFVVSHMHPVWSAEMLSAAGASETTVWLVAHHQDNLDQWADHPHCYLLERLQEADDAN